MWRALGASKAELWLANTLPTGQSFRWRLTGGNEYTGVVGPRVVQMRQEADDVLYRVIARAPAVLRPELDLQQQDHAALTEYFNLGVCMSDLAVGWAAADSRYAEVAPYFPGARMLRQDPLECTFQFICSSNNHISRIHGMVEKLCSGYGTRLSTECPEVKLEGAGPREAPEAATVGDFYSFPTLEQLSTATEEELREAGFGYRAKYIVGAASFLLQRPEGGREWLLGLRSLGAREAVAALQQLPGVGPKVAACVALFSLDAHAAIPVDTHVWKIACTYYTPHLKGKTLNKKIMEEVEAALVGVFGEYAGWAHNTLFISNLASQQEHLPFKLRSPENRRRGGEAADSSGESTSSSESDRETPPPPVKISKAKSRAKENLKPKTERASGGRPVRRGVSKVTKAKVKRERVALARERGVEGGLDSTAAPIKRDYSVFDDL